MTKPSKQLILKSGFTLVELSIVLVIIGLLIGGILVGQSLIESAKLNAQIKQLQQYDIAATQFRSKYAQMPGDSSYAFANINTYPGNNDGFLTGLSYPGYTEILYSSSSFPEPRHYFVHLYYSKMINEEYTVGGSNYMHGEGNAWPTSKLNDDGGIAVIGNLVGEVYYFMGVINVGTSNPHGYSQMSPNGILSPSQALSIDSKLDDGDPLTGDVVASTSATNHGSNWAPYPMTLESNNATGCINNNIYNTSIDDDTLCRLLVKAQFEK